MLRKVLAILIFASFSFLSVHAQKKKIIEQLELENDSLRTHILDRERFISRETYSFLVKNLANEALIKQFRKTIDSFYVERDLLLKDLNSMRSQLSGVTARVSDLQQDLVRAKDSIQLLQSNHLSDDEQFLQPIDLRLVTKSNLTEFSFDALLSEVRKAKQIKYYTSSVTDESAVFEKLINGKVVMRGFVSSACGDCYETVVNYYTLDGFMFAQSLSSACVVGEPDEPYMDLTIRYRSDPDMRAFEILTGYSKDFDYKNIQFYISELKKYRSVPPGYKLVLDRPGVFECVSVVGID